MSIHNSWSCPLQTRACYGLVDVSGAWHDAGILTDRPPPPSLPTSQAIFHPTHLSQADAATGALQPFSKTGDCPFRTDDLRLLPVPLPAQIQTAIAVVLTTGTSQSALWDISRALVTLWNMQRIVDTGEVSYSASRVSVQVMRRKKKRRYYGQKLYY